MASKSKVPIIPVQCERATGYSFLFFIIAFFYASTMSQMPFSSLKSLLTMLKSQ